jgi:hypothetical protein
MVTPEIRVHGRVTAASATSVTVTPGTAHDAAAAGTISTVTIAGTGLKGFAVGDPIAVRFTTK